MNVEQTGQVLAIAALFDNRKVDVPVVVAWHRAIGDLGYDDAAQAVQDHYGSDSTERIMPGHIRARVKAIRADRIARSLAPPPPPELADDPAAYLKALRAGITEAAEGKAPLVTDQPKPLAIAGPAVAEIEAPREASQPEPLRKAMEALKLKLGPARARQAPLASPQEIARRKAAESRAAREAAERAEGQAS